MKAAFIKAFGEKQFDISTMCADCGCTEKQYENFQKAQEAAKNEMQMPKEVMHFRLEEIYTSTMNFEHINIWRERIAEEIENILD